MQQAPAKNATSSLKGALEPWYLLLVPGTTTAPLSSFFLCKNTANLFLVLDGVCASVLGAAPSSRLGADISEELEDELSPQLFFLVFFVIEEY